LGDGEPDSLAHAQTLFMAEGLSHSQHHRCVSSWLRLATFLETCQHPNKS
jgi:hypothetical protein